MNWSVLIYPLGLMRIVQTIIAIIALSLTTNHHGSVKLEIINCSASNANATETIQWFYPYDLINYHGPAECEYVKSIEQIPYFLLSFKYQAQLFVFVGAASLTLTLCTLIVYLLKWPSYEADPRFPLLDTIASVVFTLLWLGATAYWAGSVGVMKSYLGEESIERTLYSLPYCRSDSRCKISGYNDTFGNLNFSLICGFISVILWLITSGVTLRRTSRLKSENDRYHLGSANVADAFNPSTSPPSFH